jgi:hypothetical protein
MRGGMSGDLATLHRLPDGSVEQSLKLAIASGVIPGDQPIDPTLRIHRQQAIAALEAFAPATAVSKLGDMLALTLDRERTQSFLEAYRATLGRPGELWRALGARGFDQPTIARLRTEGKLGYLTRQNAPLISRLTSTANIAATEDLPRAGLYTAEAWKALIGGDTPAGISADDYAAGLAVQVNLAYPNLVVSEMVRRGEINADVRPATDGEVAAFFSAGHGQHTIGVDPVKRWTGYTALTEGGRDGVRRVERMYQLTPSNESMMALNKLGMHSARQIASQPRELFLAEHGGEFPSANEAAMVYRKAQEIHSRALHIATTYLSYRGAPNVYAVTGTLSRDAVSGTLSAERVGVLNDVPGTPTLEALLKNMDYCACDACRSVLSPAAYFVELLEFIDVADVPAGKRNPAAVLSERRPDLQDLLLSCENTNVALPYVDLVNEILEHFIIDGSLAAFHGFNMREDSTTADLLADPEHVRDAAYDKTKSEVYPHNLPFDMPVAALRLFMRAFDTTLADALRVFRTPASARREVLGLDPTEYQILTDAAFKALPEYFGEPAATTIDGLNDAIADGKTFSRRTAITYEDLVALLRTRFINPGAPLVALLSQLRISLAQLQSWYDGDIDDAALTALLADTLDPAEYGGDILQWLRDRQALIMGLITLTDMSADVECSFADVELRFALPDAAANRLTELAYQKLHRFIRLWKKLGLDIGLTDRVVITFLGRTPESLTDANFDGTWTGLLARIANFTTVRERRSVPAKKIDDWLAIWDLTQTTDLRRERLAHLLRIGATDLAHFAEIAGIDPLADDMASDAPSLLRFMDGWDQLKAAKLKVVDLDYLLRHRDDAGTLTPTGPALLRDLKALRDGLTAVQVELGAPTPNADLALARAKMALVYDSAVVDRFVGLVGGTTTYEAPLATVEEALPAKLTSVDSRLGFDPFGKVVTWRGIMPAAAAAALDVAADALVLADVEIIQTQAALNAFIAAFKTATQALSDAGDADLQSLDAEYPELKVVYDAIAPIVDPAAQAKALLDHILPELRRRLKATALRTTLGSLLKTDRPVIDVLTEGPAVVHAANAAAAGVLQDFLRLEGAATFDGNQVYAFHLDAPATDDYILYVAAPVGTTVTLTIDGSLVIPAAAVGPVGEVQTAAELRLSSGVLTAATLSLAGLPAAGSATLRWRTRGMARTPIPASRIYMDTDVADARASLIRLQKAAMLLRALPLTPRELRHLAAINADTAGWLNDLDVDGTIGAASLHALWTKVSWLAWFTRLKADEPDPDMWVGLLEQPGQLTPKGTLVLAGVAGWTDQDLIDVLAHFGLALANLSHLHVLRTVKEAVDFVTATNQTAADFIAWAVDAPDAALIATIKQALRDRHDALSWRTTLQSVNDALRNLRRDALVSYILHHQTPAPEIDTADKLYEHFLVDVAMDACMMTSRIRLALSTVQLFITRCLMNLEPDVAASSIHADHWAWMKRYRVWEANRKIFLYPENWLEPELRDNKSPFFRELESELLKSDITDELAEEAYLSYLKKLDEVARLEIVGAYLEERQPGNQDDDVLHVFGRTNGNTHQYYYRRYEYGYWMPWEKMSLNIEGDLLLPVVWKRQLFVFWLTLVPKPQGATPKSPQSMSTETWEGHAKVTVDVNLAWGEYYRGKWTSPKSSEMKEPIRLTGIKTFEPDKVILAARTEKPGPDISERLLINVLYMGQPFHVSHAVFTSKNAAPQLRNGLDSPLFGVELANYFLLWDPQPTSVTVANALREPGKLFEVRIQQPEGATSRTLDETLFTKTAALLDGFTVRPLMHPVQNQWEAPLFYADENSTFFISGDERVELVLHYDGYFWNDIVTEFPRPDKVKIPPLYEQPVIRDPLGPVEHPLETVINRNYERVISDNTPFAYGDVAFDARGVVAKVQR